MGKNNTGAIKKLKERIGYFQAILDHSPDIIITGDKSGKIIEFNKGAETMLGYKKREVLGKPIKSFYADPKERDQLTYLLKKHGSVVDYEVRIKNKQGKIIPMSTTLAYMRNRNNKIIGTIGVAKDIRRRKFLERKLVKMSVTDGLTGLYDRGYFDKRIHVAVNDAILNDKPLGLIMMDLDGFKEYNDTKGHLEGDKILNKVGRVILRTIRWKIDSCYRYGGDEFVIIVPEKYHAMVKNIAEEIRVEVELAFGPGITASIGATELKTKQSVYDFIKVADEAMYKAKGKGGNQTFVDI